jgi:hypothetical protein
MLTALTLLSPLSLMLACEAPGPVDADGADVVAHVLGPLLLDALEESVTAPAIEVGEQRADVVLEEGWGWTGELQVATATTYTYEDQDYIEGYADAEIVFNIEREASEASMSGALSLAISEFSDSSYDVSFERTEVLGEVFIDGEVAGEAAIALGVNGYHSRKSMDLGFEIEDGTIAGHEVAADYSYYEWDF